MSYDPVPHKSRASLARPSLTEEALTTEPLATEPLTTEALPAESHTTVSITTEFIPAEFPTIKVTPQMSLTQSTTNVSRLNLHIQVFKAGAKIEGRG